MFLLCFVNTEYCNADFLHLVFTQVNDFIKNKFCSMNEICKHDWNQNNSPVLNKHLPINSENFYLLSFFALCQLLHWGGIFGKIIERWEYFQNHFWSLLKWKSFFEASGSIAKIGSSLKLNDHNHIWNMTSIIEIGQKINS